MKITNTMPLSWEELEQRVCDILNEAGYQAERSRSVETVRGSVNVDVYATSENEILKQFICECKYWNKPVPKEKIHAFRTVVHDSGSMVGIFISKSGFQSGAIEAAYCSNVLLKTWSEFLELIERQWVARQISQIQNIARPLSVFTDPLDVPYEKLSLEQKEIYKSVTQSCLEEYILCRVLKWEDYLEDSIQVRGKTYETLDELFNYLEPLIVSSVMKYKELFKDNPIEEWKFESNEHLIFPLVKGLNKVSKL